MRTALLLLVAISGACSTDTGIDRGPAVALVNTGDPATEYEVGAGAWSAVGFDVLGQDLGDVGLRECARRWYDAASRDVDCVITVRVTRYPQLVEQYKTSALSRRDVREVVVDSRVVGFDLVLAVAHEVGHVVLDTPEHTVGGVMGGSDTVLHDVDRELACRTVALGCP